MGGLLSDFCDLLRKAVEVGYSLAIVIIHYLNLNRCYRALRAEAGDALSSRALSSRRDRNPAVLGPAAASEQQEVHPTFGPGSSTTANDFEFQFSHDTPISMQSGRRFVLETSSPDARTALMLALMGEVDEDAATDTSAGNATKLAIAYVPNTAITFSETIRENILLGLPLETGLYLAAIRTADLDFDLLQFADRDLTVVASGGDNLSGGQQQRLNIARAVYHALYVSLIAGRRCLLALDAPLAALDYTTGVNIAARLGAVFRGNVNVTMVIAMAHGKNYFQDFDALVLDDSGDLLRRVTRKIMVTCEDAAQRTEDSVGSPHACICVADVEGFVAVHSSTELRALEAELLDTTDLPRTKSGPGAVLDPSNAKITRTFPALMRSFAILNPFFVSCALLGMFVYIFMKTASGEMTGFFMGHSGDENQNSFSVSGKEKTYVYRMLGSPDKKSDALRVLGMCQLIGVIGLTFNFVVAQGIGGFVAIRKLSKKVYETIFLHKKLIGFFDSDKLGVIQNRVLTGTGLDIYSVFIGRNAFAVPVQYTVMVAGLLMFFISIAKDMGILQILILMACSLVPMAVVYFSLIRAFRCAIIETQRRYLIARSSRDEAFCDVECAEARRVLKLMSYGEVVDRIQHHKNRTDRHIATLSRAQFATVVLRQHLILNMSMVALLLPLVVYGSRLIDAVMNKTPEGAAGPGTSAILLGMIAKIQDLLNQLIDPEFGFFPKLPDLETDLVAFARLLQYETDDGFGGASDQGVELQSVGASHGGGGGGGGSSPDKEETKPFLAIKDMDTTTNSEDDHMGGDYTPTLSPVGEKMHPTTHLAVDNITIAYGQTIALHNFSLHLNRGERVMVTGRSGSGKSSLFMALLKLVDLAAGKIRVLKDSGETLVLNSAAKNRRDEGEHVEHDTPTETVVGATEIAETVLCAFPQSSLALEGCSIFENVHPQFACEGGGATEGKVASSCFCPHTGPMGVRADSFFGTGTGR